MTDFETFGRYELQERLAFGGMAEIFLATMRSEHGFSKRVVIKRILPQFSGDETFAKMFIDEAVLAARLSHPNIVQIYDFGEIAHSYYIAMEYVEGLDLRRLLRRDADSNLALEPSVVASIGVAMCKALSFAHNLVDEKGNSLSLVHRDVSPHNIMISRLGEMKLTDFGIAKAADRLSHTRTGAIKGKIAYMAPEQAAGLAMDKRSDQFALGVVLWECLAGRRLFEGGSERELMRLVIECRIPNICELSPKVPEPFGNVLAKMLAPAPEQRYTDLRDAEADLAPLRKYLDTEILTSLVEEKGKKPAEPKRQTAVLSMSLSSNAAATDFASQEQAQPPTVSNPPKTSEQLATTQGSVPKQMNSLSRSMTWRVPVSVMVVFGLLGLGYWTLNREPEPMVLPANTERIVDPPTAPPTSVLVTPKKEEKNEPELTEATPKNAPFVNHRKTQRPSGTLSLRSAERWYDVYLGERKLGTTPLDAVRVPAGDLKLRLVNREAGIDKTFDVKVEANAETRKTVYLK